MVELASQSAVARKGVPFYGKQRQSRDLENTGTLMGHNVILGDPGVNVFHENPGVNVSVINGRPTRVFKFKLTTANVASRIFKPESGRCVVKYLGDMGINKPKFPSDGPGILKHTGRLVKAQSVATADPLRVGNTVKPNTSLLNSSAHSIWVVGESSCSGGTRSLEYIVAPAIGVPEHVTQSEDHPDVVGKATVASSAGFIGEAVIEGGMGAIVLTPMSAVLSPGMTVVPTGSGLEVSTHQRNLLLDQNQFAPLSAMGNEMGFCFGVSDDLT